MKRVSGLDPESELAMLIQAVAAFYTNEQIHFRFQKSRHSFFFISRL